MNFNISSGLSVVHNKGVERTDIEPEIPINPLLVDNDMNDFCRPLYMGPTDLPFSADDICKFNAQS
jgi:hypothetical protein